ncbi:MAG TPA: hypothetical protein VGJ09_12630 [Bryobacteraceae bacterium]|jgi:hypothetical protein
MNKRFCTSILAAFAVAALLPFLPVNGVAQDKSNKEKGKDGKGKLGGPGGYIEGKSNTPVDPPPPVGPTPHMADGKVNFSGVWLPGTFGFASLGQVSLQPWAEALYKQRRDSQGKDDPEAHCLPTGVPRLSPYPYKILQTPGEVAILFEGNIHSFREIFTDGRGHPGADDMLPTWMGDSIGKWEGDTLVVDTVGFNDKTWLNGGGMPHSDQLRVIERYRRPDLGHLEIEITMEDPKAFTKPDTFKRVHTLTQTWEIHEYICNENPIDTPHIVGK